MNNGHGANYWGPRTQLDLPIHFYNFVYTFEQCSYSEVTNLRVNDLIGIE